MGLSGQAGGSERNLYGEWQFGHESGSAAGADDSLIAPAWPGAPPGPAPGPLGEDDDPRVIDAFTLGSLSREEHGAGWSLSAPPRPQDSGLWKLPEDVPGPERVPAVLPEAGDVLGGFAIVGELGRGAFARVYLARQENLGHRLVALKVSKAEGDEPQILARLQHAHIVPIHSVHDDPATGLRLLCMPFLGGANLAQVLDAVSGPGPHQASGRGLVDALDSLSQHLQSVSGLEPAELSPSGMPEVSRPRSRNLSRDQPRHDDPHDAPDGLPARRSRSRSLWARFVGPVRRLNPHAPDPSDPGIMQPARRFLREANSIQAAVWIVARLAEGLDHAHSRGLLHRDLKPSNVLIAGDGTPMLLDFNLAASSDPGDQREGARAILGGTLPYMAPEHLAAFHPRSTVGHEAVDERSDLYALGLILFEIIAGEHPFREPPPGLPVADLIDDMSAQRRQPPSLRALRADVPWSLDALVAKCLDFDPDRRFARARDLAEDLGRFLDDLPFKYAPEPSVRERFGKWARRHPAAFRGTTITLLATVLLLGALALVGLLSANLQQVTARLKYRSFQSLFTECQFLLNTTNGPPEHLEQGIALAEQALRLQGIVRDGAWPGQPWSRGLSPREQVGLREEASELLVLEARARTYQAARGGSEAALRAALEWAVDRLDRAERIDPHPPSALYADRARYVEALGKPDRAARDRARAAATPPVRSREFALLGTSLLVGRDLPAAETALQRAVALDSQRFWAWFSLGHCHFNQGRFLEAAGDFSVCTALQPRFAWPHLNRGLALARAGRLNDARLAYDRALTVSPRFAEARVNRALTRLELNDPAGARDDLEAAVALGRDGPGVLAALGEAWARLGRRDEAERHYAALLGREPDNASYRVARAVLRLSADPAGARADLDHVLRRDPRHARAQYVLARLLLRDDPDAALDHVRRALDADPALYEALELRALLGARRGDLAAIDDVERLIQAPTSHRFYNGACALAVLSQTAEAPRLAARALSLLGRALDAGFPPAEMEADRDLDALRGRPEFAALLAKAKARPPR